MVRESAHFLSRGSNGYPIASTMRSFAACRLDEGFRKQYQARCHHKAKGVAKVAAARRLAVRLYWMLRTNTAYPEIARIESSPPSALINAAGRGLTESKVLQPVHTTGDAVVERDFGTKG